jgi:membrane associated rhomboid family serine protease
VRQPPKLKDLQKYPIVAGLSLLAIGVTVAWWAKVDISPLFDTAEIRRGQLWRLVTCILPHLDVLHLVFNIYWLWIFGTLIEDVLGHGKTILLILLFAIGSSSVDFALGNGGLGLSGVGYALFGLLCVLAQRDERFHGAMDQKTIQVFVGWFFLCIVLTVAHVYAVANIAHATGAVLGALVGYAVTAPHRRLLYASTITVILVFGLWGSTLGRPIVNLSGKAGYDEGKWGYDDLIAGKNSEAVKWLGDAVKLRPKDAIFWYDLGIACERTGRTGDATSAYRKAHELEPDNAKYADTADPKPN